MLLQIFGNGPSPTVDVELLGPRLIFWPSWVLKEAVQTGVNDMQLSIEPIGVNDTLSIRVFAFEKHLIRL